MEQHIITPMDKLKWIVRIRKMMQVYRWSFVASLFVFVLISILPFACKWIPTSGSEPQEAVVRVHAGDSQGSGFLISPYYIITARHVVEDLNIGDQVAVSFDRAKIPIDMVATIEYYRPRKGEGPDFENDVAILMLEKEIRQISPLRLANSDEFKTGQVTAMGYGLDDWSEPDGKITSDAFYKNNKLYKMNVDIQKGHSGGPLLKTKDGRASDEVVGIVVGDYGTILSYYTGSLVAGEGVALKINQADKVLSSAGYSIRN